jgi:hypothetical protein
MPACPKGEDATNSDRRPPTLGKISSQPPLCTWIKPPRRLKDVRPTYEHRSNRRRDKQGEACPPGLSESIERRKPPQTPTGACAPQTQQVEPWRTSKEARLCNLQRLIHGNGRERRRRRESVGNRPHARRSTTDEHRSNREEDQHSERPRRLRGACPPALCAEIEQPIENLKVPQNNTEHACAPQAQQVEESRRTSQEAHERNNLQRWSR